MISCLKFRVKVGCHIFVLWKNERESRANLTLGGRPKIMFASKGAPPARPRKVWWLRTTMFTPMHLPLLMRMPKFPASIFEFQLRSIVRSGIFLGSHSQCIPRSVVLRLQGDAFLV
jgi:hypothetical protein